MKRFLKSLIFGFGVAATAISAGEAHAGKLYVFGDSLSDNGNLSTATLGVLPGAGYYYDPGTIRGRFSNAPVWTERLGYKTGRAPGLFFTDPFLPFFVDGYNFAHGGAATGPQIGSITYDVAQAVIPGFSVLRQAQRFREFGFRGGRDDLFTVWSGANDYITWAPSLDNPGALVANAVNNIDATVRTLDGAGARKMVVVNLPDLGATPGAFALGPDAQAVRTAIAQQHNAALKARLTSLDASLPVRIIQVDAAGLFSFAAANPRLFGIDVVRPGDAGSRTGNCLGDGYTAATCNAGSDPKYLFFDTVHPTDIGHSVFAGFVGLYLVADAVAPRTLVAQQSGATAVTAGQTTALRARYAAAFDGARGVGAIEGGAARFADGAIAAAPALSVYVAAPQTFAAEGLSALAAFDETARAEAKDWAAPVALVGADIALSPSVTLGAFAARGRAVTAFDATGARVESRGGGAYLLLGRDGANLSFEASRTREDYALERMTGFAPLPIARGETRGRTDGVAVMGERLFDYGGAALGLEMRAEAARSDVRGYRETGTRGLIDLDIPGAVRERTSGYLGFAARVDGGGEKARWRFDAGAGAAEAGGEGAMAGRLVDLEPLARVEGDGTGWRAHARFTLSDGRGLDLSAAAEAVELGAGTEAAALLRVSAKR